MTFVEAAVALLREAGSHMPVEQLAELAVERALLDKPGKNPLGSLKRQLTAELRKGDAARVVRVEKDVWALPEAAPAAAEPEPAAGAEPEVAAEPARELTEEEKELTAIYGAEPEPAAAYTEYRDEQTDDEDRPMRKEIIPKAEQRRQRRQRRERGERGERGRRGRGRGRDRDRDRDSDRGRDRDRSDRPQRASTEPIEIDGLDLAGAAVQLLRANDPRRPMTARRIADSLHGRGLIPGAPPKPARAIKAALLHAASTRRARGLRPQVSYLGSDQFALATRDLSRDVAAAEAAVERALADLEAATRRALGERLAKLSLSELERAAGLYLHATGWRELEWVKRVDKSAYAQAVAPGSDDVWLIGVRVGPQPIDRRGVGELRVGVKAKSLAAGLLLSPVELSDDAADELDKDGPPLQILIGPSFVANLAAVGVGVSAQAAPVLYLDAQFFAEIRDE